MSETSPFEHPKQIGPYHILQVIGEGGMGVVYEAEQKEPVRRRVALKMLKLGMDTKEIIGRFEAERQALAVMEHPGIAKVFDAGATEQGRPYFAMELVRGVRLDEYCDRHRLSTRQRLELFIGICEAVQHAHQKGVIHRDLKPSNVLVTEEGGRATPKIIDFGVAKATGQRLTEQTVVTTYGQALGTLAYMSPEQAEMSGLDVDTRTDIYSLGVVLAELLTNRVPLDPKEVGAPAFLVELIQRDQPVRTLTQSLDTLEGAQLESVARDHGTTVTELKREISGDLQWIVLKAMEKDRGRRYQTANGLAMDVRRYLDDEPVAARSPTPTYRFRKFVRRNKAGTLIGALAVLALMTGATATTFGMLQARAARDIARQEAETATQVSDFLVRLFEVSNPSEALGNSISAREILDLGAAEIREDLADQPVVQARLMGTMGRVYRSLGLFDEARPLLERALVLRERELGPTHLDVAQSLKDLANLHQAYGNFDDVEPMLRRALTIEEAALGLIDVDVGTTVSALATLYWVQGRYDQAEPLLRRSMSIEEQVFGPDHERTAIALSNLGGLLSSQSRLDEAEPLLLRALAIRDEVLEPNHPDLGVSLTNLGALYQVRGDLSQAEPHYLRAREIFEATLGTDHPNTASSLNNLGELYMGLGRLDEAETYLLQALGIKENVLAADHPSTANTLWMVANLYRDQTRHREAEAAYRRALLMLERTFEPCAPQMTETLKDYAILLRALGRIAEADSLDSVARCD